MLYEWLEGNGMAPQMMLLIESGMMTLCVFLLTLVSTRLILPVLQAKKLNQPINMYVTEHAGKAGTPTMGGICFVISTLLAALAWLTCEKFGLLGDANARALLPLILTLLLAVGNALIGFIDDYKKLVKKENEGLTEIQKLILQLVVVAAYLCMMGMTDNLSTALHIPFTAMRLELGWFAYVFYLIVIVGFVNSTNITDGIDGLASSQGAAVAVALMAFTGLVGSRCGGIAGGLLLGAMLGFLVFNRYPAKVFMGDTGSLYIGGMIMGVAVAEGELLAVILMSLVFIFEMLTSLLQRLYFKLSGGKRLFKKAPIHHTFQLMGWSENKIVGVFLAVTAVLCLLGVWGII